MQIRSIFILFFILFPTAFLFAGEHSPAMMFAAASTTNVMSAASRDFQKVHQKKIVISFAASSTLARQIENGAPAAIYLSANTKWMDYLAAKGFVDQTQRIILFSNRLAVIAPKGHAVKTAFAPESSLVEYLGDGYLALANPDHTPVGIYAKQSLKSLDLWEHIKNRVARTKDVRAALMLVERKETPLGIVYMTDAGISTKVTVIATLPEESHSPIVYWCGLVSGHESPTARTFFNYLQSKRARKIFQFHGFSVSKK